MVCLQVFSPVGPHEISFKLSVCVRTQTHCTLAHASPTPHTHAHYTHAAQTDTPSTSCTRQKHGHRAHKPHATTHATHRTLHTRSDTHLHREHPEHTHRHHHTTFRHTAWQTRTDTDRQTRIKQASLRNPHEICAENENETSFSLFVPRGVCEVSRKKKKKKGTAPRIAVLAPFPDNGLLESALGTNSAPRQRTNTSIPGAVAHQPRAQNTTMSDETRGQQGRPPAPIHMRFLLMLCSPRDTCVLIPPMSRIHFPDFECTVLM